MIDKEKLIEAMAEAIYEADPYAGADTFEEFCAKMPKEVEVIYKQAKAALAAMVRELPEVHTVSYYAPEEPVYTKDNAKDLYQQLKGMGND